jgi:hypothetical protein
VEGGKISPVLITNKHVIEGTSHCDLVIHASAEAGAKKPNSLIRGYASTSEWLPHPDAKIDLCALPISGVVNHTSPFPFLRYLDPGMIPSQAQLEELNAVEDILMVGYPNGLWDATNNYPLIRRGITASHPGVDFDVSGVGTSVVDIACFPGSSGSPVFIYNNGMIADKKGNVAIASRTLFLGVLYSGPTFQADGQIVIRTIPTTNVPMAQLNLMMNLGYIIKSRELHSLEDLVLTKYNLKRPT